MTSTTSPLPMRGREEELKIVQHALERAQSGRGSVIVVEGGTGMGKTRLLQEAWARGVALSFRMGRGMADPADRVVELALLYEALYDNDPPLLGRHTLRNLHPGPEQRFWQLQEIQARL